MLYFDNAATGGRKPDEVLSAVSSSLRVCANPGRSGHKLSLSCAKLVHDTRRALNTFFDGYGYDRVAFTKNCTEALNLAIFGVLKKGDHVVTTCMEHNSVLRPLEFLKKAGYIEYDVCPLTGERASATLDYNAFSSLIRPNTRLAIVTTASNVNGAIPSLTKIKKSLPKRVLLLCDGAQGAGHFSIKMQETGIDLLTIAGHKGMLAIQGSGALLFSERVDPAPLFYGGTGSISLSLDMPDFYPDRLEAGTLNFPAVTSILEGARFLTIHGKEIENKLMQLSQYCINGLKNLPSYTVYSKANPCGIVAFSHAKFDAEQIAEKLSSQYGIAVRGGLHCAPLMHEALGSLDGGLVRASFSHDNAEKEIDCLIHALKDLDER